MIKKRTFNKHHLKKNSNSYDDKRTKPSFDPEFPQSRFFKPKRPPKICHFKENNLFYVDYKDIYLLKKFISPGLFILPRFKTRLKLKYQKRVACAIKRARTMALLPYVN